MRLMHLITLLACLCTMLHGCGGDDASAQPSQTVSGTAILTFYLPNEAGQMKCSASISSMGKIQINQMQKAGADQYRLNGTMSVRERTSSSARIFVRAMLYKNGRPDGSFDFTVEVTPNNTKIVNLGMGMMLHASL
ncbi:MAG TPA: hypothetical protein DCM28_12755 [Phycisphaerales bacterium]|nr:hypothetical protein [Phycisphaerales bacterium]